MHILTGTNIHVVAPPEKLAFYHRNEMELRQPITALAAWNLARKQPVPGLSFAMWLRDAIATRFGVQPIHGFREPDDSRVAVGDKIDFFTVEYISDETLTLSAPDRHLNVFLCINRAGSTLSFTSSVVTYNRFGRIYMLPVRPAHKLIAAYMMRRLRKALEDGPNRPMDAAPG